jgi:restriction endonuclease S subunit
METYLQYKHSRINLIKEIPQDWKEVKLKYLANVYTGKTPSSTNEEYYEKGSIDWYGPGDFKCERLKSSRKKITTKAVNDIGINLFKPQSLLLIGIGATLGKIAITEKSCFSNQQINAITFKDNIYPKYALYYFISQKHEILRAANSSTLAILNQAQTKDLFMIVPSINEQTQIAKYLDYKTGLIDDIIAKKEALITKLTEQRQAIINEAVTKGLNPDAPMKDSGIDWLGEIAEHWEVVKLKYLLNVKSGIKIGPFGSALKLDTLATEGIKIYGQGNVIKDNFDLGFRYLTKEVFQARFMQYEIIDGDVLVTMMGTTGKSKVFKKEYKKGILDSHLIRLRFNKDLIISDLFSILLDTSNYILQQLNRNSKGSIMAGLNSTIIKNLVLILPPIEVQKELLREINKTEIFYSTLISTIDNQIKKLKEYRQSIISEAVTGKVDVRDWVELKT